MIKLLAILSLAVMAGCTSFTSSTREFSEAHTAIMTTAMVRNNILLKHLLSTLEAYKERALADTPGATEVYLAMENPTWDPNKPDESDEFLLINVDDYIDDIRDTMVMNLSLAESQEILNASLQQNKALTSLIEGVKAALSDEEMQELIKIYWPMIKEIREKAEEKIEE